MPRVESIGTGLRCLQTTWGGGQSVEGEYTDAMGQKSRREKLLGDTDLKW